MHIISIISSWYPNIVFLPEAVLAFTIHVCVCLFVQEFNTGVQMINKYMYTKEPPKHMFLVWKRIVFHIAGSPSLACGLTKWIWFCHFHPLILQCFRASHIFRFDSCWFVKPSSLLFGPPSLPSKPLVTLRLHGLFVNHLYIFIFCGKVASTFPSAKRPGLFAQP